MLGKDIQTYPDQEKRGESEKIPGHRRTIAKYPLSGKKSRHDQIAAGSCHGFSVVTITISYRDFNATVDCFCSCRRVSDALADFIPLLFSFLFDNDEKKKTNKKQKRQTYCPPGESHMFSIWRFVQTGGAEGLRPTAGSQSFHAPLGSLPGCYGCLHPAILKPSNIPLAPA